MAKKISKIAREHGVKDTDVLDFIKSTGEYVATVNDAIVSIIETKVIDAIENGKIKKLPIKKKKPKAKTTKKNQKEATNKKFDIKFKESKNENATEEQNQKINNDKDALNKNEIVNSEHNDNDDEDNENIPTPSMIRARSSGGNNPYTTKFDYDSFDNETSRKKSEMKNFDPNNNYKNNNGNDSKFKYSDSDKLNKFQDKKSKNLLGTSPNPFIKKPVFANPSVNFKKKHGVSKTQGAFGKGKRNKYKHKQQFETTNVGGIDVQKGDGSEILLRKGATLSDFAEKINADSAQLVSILFKLGEMVTSTQTLDEDILATLGLELNYDVKFISSEDEDSQLLKSMNIALVDVSKKEDQYKVPPVITIMGHVDHGKTKLLDTILNENIIETESGGITQKIGASMIEKTVNGEKRFLTFIDTPGHEAFTSMRKRGAHVTDVAILVVAADDGVMPQTIEAISHAKAAKVPIVVAINKIDLPNSNTEKVISELMKHDLVPEEYGGKTIMVQISAKENKNIDKLLDAVVLTADADASLISDPSSNIRGTIIESRKLSGQGIATTILVKNGHLRVGDSIVAGTAHGFVRAIINEWGKNINTANPSEPVRILGLSRAPHAGDIVIRTENINTARHIGEQRLHNFRQAQFMRTNKRITLENIDQEIKEGKVDRLNLIIKAEGSGELEALINSINQIKIDDGNEVGVDIIHKGVGNITHNDVNLAEADNSIIIAFNVGTEQKIDSKKVDIKKYNIIYEVTDDIEKALKGMLAPIEVEVTLGRAEVRQVFKSSKFGSIAGSIVKSGIIKRNANAKIFAINDGKEVLLSDNQRIESLKHFKDDATEVKEGLECGIGLSGFDKIDEDNIIECFEIEKHARE